MGLRLRPYAFMSISNLQASEVGYVTVKYGISGLAEWRSRQSMLRIPYLTVT